MALDCDLDSTLIKAGFLVQAQLTMVQRGTHGHDLRSGVDAHRSKNKSSFMKPKTAHSDMINCDISGLRLLFARSLQGYITFPHISHALAKLNGKAKGDDQGDEESDGDTSDRTKVIQKAVVQLRRFETDQIVTCRITAVLPTTPTTVFLSLLPHIVRWQHFDFGPPMGGEREMRLLANGRRFTEVTCLSSVGNKVMCVFVDRGKDVSRNRESAEGAESGARASHSDECASASLLLYGCEKVDGDYLKRVKAGQVCESARLLFTNRLEGAAYVSLLPQVNDKSVVVGASELPGGMVVSGEIIKTDEHGIIVVISNGTAKTLIGRVYAQHISDDPLDNVSESQFVKGMKAVFRILKPPTIGSKLSLTAKSALVKDKSPILSLDSDVFVGRLATGFISGLRPASKTITVTFFNGITAALSGEEVSLHNSQQATQSTSTRKRKHQQTLLKDKRKKPPMKKKRRGKAHQEYVDESEQVEVDDDQGDCDDEDMVEDTDMQVARSEITLHHRSLKLGSTVFVRVMSVNRLLKRFHVTLDLTDGYIPADTSTRNTRLNELACQTENSVKWDHMDIGITSNFLQIADLMVLRPFAPKPSKAKVIEVIRCMKACELASGVTTSIKGTKKQAKQAKWIQPHLLPALSPVGSVADQAMVVAVLRKALVVVFAIPVLNKKKKLKQIRLSVATVPIEHLSDDSQAANKEFQEIKISFASAPGSTPPPVSLRRPCVLLSLSAEVGVASGDSNPRQSDSKGATCGSSEFLHPSFICCPVISMKQSLILAASTGRSFVSSPKSLALSMEMLRGRVVPGYVRRFTPTGVLISLGDWYVMGVAHRSKVLDVPVETTKELQEAGVVVGQSILVKVLSIKMRVSGHELSEFGEPGGNSSKFGPTHGIEVMLDARPSVVSSTKHKGRTVDPNAIQSGDVADSMNVMMSQPPVIDVDAMEMISHISPLTHLDGEAQEMDDVVDGGDGGFIQQSGLTRLNDVDKELVVGRTVCVAAVTDGEGRCFVWCKLGSPADGVSVRLHASEAALPGEAHFNDEGDYHEDEGDTGISTNPLRSFQDRRQTDSAGVRWWRAPLEHITKSQVIHGQVISVLKEMKNTGTEGRRELKPHWSVEISQRRRPIQLVKDISEGHTSPALGLTAPTPFGFIMGAVKTIGDRGLIVELQPGAAQRVRSLLCDTGDPFETSKVVKAITGSRAKDNRKSFRPVDPLMEAAGKLTLGFVQFPDAIDLSSMSKGEMADTGAPPPEGDNASCTPLAQSQLQSRFRRGMVIPLLPVPQPGIDLAGDQPSKSTGIGGDAQWVRDMQSAGNGSLSNYRYMLPPSSYKLRLQALRIAQEFLSSPPFDVGLNKDIMTHNPSLSTGSSYRGAGPHIAAIFSALYSNCSSPHPSLSSTPPQSEALRQQHMTNVLQFPSTSALPSTLPSPTTGAPVTTAGLSPQQLSTIIRALAKSRIQQPATKDINTIAQLSKKTEQEKGETLKALADACCTFPPGSLVRGRVRTLLKGAEGCIVDLRHGVGCRVHAREIGLLGEHKASKANDSLPASSVSIQFSHATQAVVVGQILEIIVLGVCAKPRPHMGIFLDGTMRGSYVSNPPPPLKDKISRVRLPSIVIQRPPYDAKTLAVGDHYLGIVDQASGMGVFVDLSPTVRGRISLDDAHSSPLSPDEIVEMYPPGTILPDIEVIRVTVDVSGQVRLSLRPGHLSEKQLSVQFEQIEVGDVLACHIKSVHDFGVICRIDNTSDSLEGLIKRDKDSTLTGSGGGVSARERKKISQKIAALRSGDPVVTKVTDIDRSKRQFDLSLSPWLQKGHSEGESGEKTKPTAMPMNIRKGDEESQNTGITELSHLSAGGYVVPKSQTGNGDDDFKYSDNEDDESNSSIPPVDDDVITLNQEEEEPIEPVKPQKKKKKETPPDSADMEDERPRKKNKKTKAIEAEKLTSLQERGGNDRTDLISPSVTTATSATSPNICPSKRGGDPFLSLMSLDDDYLNEIAGMSLKPDNRMTVDLDEDTLPTPELNIDDTEQIEAEEDENEKKNQTKTRRKEARKLKRETQRQTEEAIASEERRAIAEAQAADSAAHSGTSAASGGVTGTGPQQTCDDFERMLLSRANDAEVWISYMAHHVELSELSKARSIGERAIQRVSFTRETDRLNLWLAYLNLECAFGDDKHLEDLLKRALEHNDSKKVMMHMTYLYSRHSRRPDAIEAARKACVKFPQSKKMWMRHLELLFISPETQASLTNLGSRPRASRTATPAIDVEEVQKVMLSALQRLPPKKHIPLLTKTARLEYKYGSIERGKTIFEKIVTEYPKRVDLWQQYVETHTAAHTPHTSGADSDDDLAFMMDEALRSSVRQLFERVTSLMLKPRNMKTFYSLWLQFETKWGDPQGLERTQSKATQFVEQFEG
eukprot:GHVN01000927.1.p1 GENE.GHVN01000927.1~~GHVN01000927.1.p1  ORF type:complete len:2686 (+),score=470.19 GHVN01000927.1:876-8060(+)